MRSTSSPPDVSVVVCTHRRPALLRQLLDSILRQKTALTFEVIVVDNDPASGSVGAVPASFPSVHWTQEPRLGLSYARNAGIRTALADVVVLADDDIQVPPDWLEELVAPVRSEGYDAVTGPMFPLKLETEAERLFESYGGHGHARRRVQFDRAWLDRQRLYLPLWQIGCLGNAAVRREVFTARVGWLEVALGVGTPAGAWEDLEYFYRMLRAGCRILHAPVAAVRHVHRRDLAGLRRQLAGYRRGEVCFCLLTAVRYREPRALSHLLLWVPALYLKLFAQELGRRLRGRRLIPFSLMGHELLAFASGPVALGRALGRKRKLARQPPVPGGA